MDTSERFKICAKKLGAQIKSIRKAKGLTQIELAERAHMNGTYVGDVERATENISIYKLISLADALEVPVSELIKPLDDHTVSSKNRIVSSIQQNLYKLDEESLICLYNWIEFMLYKQTQKR